MLGNSVYLRVSGNLPNTLQHLQRHMKFKDFALKSDNHFVAMQYYGLILNRTFLVILTNNELIGIKVNGLVSVESGGNIIAKEIFMGGRESN